MFDLSGKTALVTGSTAGIGLAIATGLLEAGARVIVNGRGSTSVQAAVDKLQKQYPKAWCRGGAASRSSA